MTSRFLCIHGHFYQPPREDPMTGVMPVESGALPFENWNEKILAECYRPNATLGNFERISFNIGPTLGSWMANYAPDISRQIVAQDKANFSRYGVGNAIAQPYNHTILPLASERDKVTQVVWGIAEFENRFGRKPQGMWLPETAVDYETLSVLAEQGIGFTILAPWQADADHLDITEPYKVSLPEGRQIVVFYYHGPLSAGISFTPELTVNADRFVTDYLIQSYSSPKRSSGDAQLLLLATDGELYGHHQPLRDYFLARLTDGATALAGVKMTYPALWLKEHPVQRAIQIKERTSWSCHHGITRWFGECECTPGQGTWKETLRKTYDWLASALDWHYEQAARPLIKDIWTMRNRYIEVILGERSCEDLIYEMAGRNLPSESIRQLRLLLEAQRERQRIFTSCSWFFGDLERIEPRNGLTHAAMMVHLLYQSTGIDLSRRLGVRLRAAVNPRTGNRADDIFYRALQRIRQHNITGG